MTVMTNHLLRNVFVPFVQTGDYVLMYNNYRNQYVSYLGCIATIIYTLALYGGRFVGCANGTSCREGKKIYDESE